MKTDNYPAKKAYLIKDLPGYNGKACLYKMDPAYEGHNYVVASATVIPYLNGKETYLFPATFDGTVISWSELNGSMRGVYSHKSVFDIIEYIIVSE